MPRVSARYRQARRDQIAKAAIACLERRGVHDTTIADIVTESGLSTGAIYSHFTNKAELVRYIASFLLFPRLDELAGAVQQGNGATTWAAPDLSDTATDETLVAEVASAPKSAPAATLTTSASPDAPTIVTPADVLGRILTLFNLTELPPSVILQLWAESTFDPDLHAEVATLVTRILGSLSQAILPWARSQTVSQPEASQLAERTAKALLALAQGYVAFAAVFGIRLEPRDYVQSIIGAFGDC